MKPSVTAWVSLGIAIIVGGSLIAIGANKMTKRHKHLKTECAETTYYVIGDRGHIQQIYECPESYRK